MNVLQKAGFDDLVRCEINESEDPQLFGLETRKESKLIIEGRKS